MEGINERLLHIIRDKSDDNRAKFARKSHIREGTLHNYVKGRIPNVENLQKICAAFDVNMNWLVNGEGNKYNSANKNDTPIYNKVSDSEKIEPPNFNKPDPGEFDYVPLSDAQLSAGGGNFVLSESIVGHYSFKRSWLRRVATAKRNLILMLVKGDSMEPGVLEAATAWRLSYSLPAWKR